MVDAQQVNNCASEEIPQEFLNFFSAGNLSPISEMSHNSVLMPHNWILYPRNHIPFWAGKENPFMEVCLPHVENLGGNES